MIVSPDESSEVISAILIEVHKSGALKISGYIQDKQYALNLIDAARSEIINYHKRNSPIIIPHALE